MMNFGKLTITALVVSALATTLGCSQEADKAKVAAQQATTPVVPTVNAASGKDVQNALSAQILPGIEGAFKSRNAKARWEGTVLHVRMEGDTSKSMAGWTDCRVLGHFLKAGQTAVLEFPNGTLQCTEVLKEQ